MGVALANYCEASSGNTTGTQRAKKFTAIARVDTPEEVSYYQHGGILTYVLRQMI